MKVLFLNRHGIYLLMAINCFNFTMSYGQYNALNHTSQFWSEVDFSGRVSQQLKWQFDLQYSGQSLYNKLNLFKFASQITVRPWLHYYPVKGLRISTFVGLWYNFAIPWVGARMYPEIRTAVQANYYISARRHTILNRIRPELREIRDTDGKFELVGRVRYELKYQYLILHSSFDKNSLYLITFDELFANLGSDVTGNKVFDQNRVFIGLGYGVTDNISIETGYSNQFQLHAHDNDADMNHAWQLSLLIDGLDLID